MVNSFFVETYFYLCQTDVMMLGTSVMESKIFLSEKSELRRWIRFWPQLRIVLKDILKITYYD
jgi:hypothetical protein